ncbi:peptidylprolyl isomerase [Natronoglycomyces albus]|uniref:Peptidyl-prolyl cis-trans isomerase n=2 Tax=Natronoglycomyces albus TaxID=2811108 RepID=A0A895XMZ3_9ACTN|nr:peptidylprolyl isomerase [Natronoglycomyces albus]
MQTMTIQTNLGTIAADVDTAAAPCTSSSFTFLAEQNYYDDTRCHRLTTDGIFVLQCGDPNTQGGIGDDAGSGGPGYQFPEENLPEDAENNYPAGTLAMANAGPDTTGSQFFLVYDDTTLPADYTIVGTITEGLDIVEGVAADGVIPDSGMAPTDGQPETEVIIESLTMSDIS